MHELLKVMVDTETNLRMAAEAPELKVGRACKVIDMLKERKNTIQYNT